MYVLIKHSPLAWRFATRLPNKRRYSLHEAETAIKENQAYCLQNHVTVILDLGIYDQGQGDLLFRDEVELGTEAGYLGNLVAIVQHTFKEVLTSTSKADADAFVAKLSQAMEAERKPEPPQTAAPQGLDHSSTERLEAGTGIEKGTMAAEKPALQADHKPQEEEPAPEAEPRPEPKPMPEPEREPKPDPKPGPMPAPMPEPGPGPDPEPEPEQEPEPEPTPMSQPLPESEADPQPGPKLEPAIEESQVSPPVEALREARREKAPRHWRLKVEFNRSALIKAAVGLLLALLVGFGGYRLFYTPQAAAPPSYQKLIKAEKYVQAGKDYPSKRAAIESLLVSEGSDEGLEKYTRKYPSDNGTFDLAYAQERYLAVIKASQDATMTRVRKSKLAVAYLKTKQYDQAAVINKDLNDKDLEGLIALGYIQTGQFDQAKQVNEQLKNKTIDQAIQTGETYAAAVKHYEAIAKDKTKSPAERAQAKTSAASFKHQLETLGE